MLAPDSTPVFVMPRHYPHLELVASGGRQRLVACSEIDARRLELGSPLDAAGSHVEAHLAAFSRNPELHSGPPNELLSIASTYVDAAGIEATQRWSVRRRDAQLLSLSRVHAGHAAEQGVQPTTLPVSVLVSGFAPFGGDIFNASTEAAKLVTEAGVRALLSIPPWIRLELELEVLTNVDVVWTCGAERVQANANPGRPSAFPMRGGKAIVQRAKQMNRGLGADLVLLVGEHRGMDACGNSIRLDHFARNRGANAGRHVDNDGNRLKVDNGALLSGGPEYLEASIPRLAWAYAARRLLEHGVALGRPDVEVVLGPDGGIELARDWAGAFVCNESYYQLLHEAYFGADGDGPSGRWVQLAHVAAARDDCAAIGSALTRTLAALLQYMLWAPEGFGYVGTADAGLLVARGAVVCS